MFSEDNFHLVTAAHPKVSKRKIGLEFFVDEFEVESLGQVCGRYFESRFCESFSETNPLSSMERCVGAGIPLLSTWCEADWIGVVKSFRDEFKGLLPLGGVMVEGVEVNGKEISFPDIDSSDFCVYCQVQERASGYRRLDSLGFLDNAIQIFQVTYSFKVDYLVNDFSL